MTLLRLPISFAILLYQSVALALSQIWANKMRGVLTTLGILIGVAAISAVIALIDGMKERVLAEFESYGSNKIFIEPRWRESDLGRDTWARICFKNSDFDELLERCPSIVNFTRDAGYGGMPMAYRAKYTEERTDFCGVDPTWFEIERRGVSVGRAMTALDSLDGRRVCLINKRLRDEFKLDRDPEGEIIEVAYFGRMRVVGLLDDPATLIGGRSDRGEMYVPFTFTTRRFNWPTWYNVIATTASRQTVEEAKAEIEFYLRQKRRLRPGDEDNFAVTTATRAIDEIDQLAGTLTTIAGGIVSISLLVGGVGIMNIMLVSVSERTREIGLRKAVGARPGAICMQFLVEAIVLCLLGGAMGLAGGQAITSAVAAMLPSNPDDLINFRPREGGKLDINTAAATILLPKQAIVLAFIFSASVGVVFGFFPAIKAASLDPIDALRHE